MHACLTRGPEDLDSSAFDIGVSGGAKVLVHGVFAGMAWLAVCGLWCLGSGLLGWRYSEDRDGRLYPTLEESPIDLDYIEFSP